ncbi:galactose-3-O-sulfotransferase 4-like [Arapaima gigas]
MIVHRCSGHLWRHRVTVLLVALVTTLLLILWAAQLLQHPRTGRTVMAADRINYGKHATALTVSSTAHRGGGGHMPKLRPPRNPVVHTARRRRRHLPPVAFVKMSKTGGSTVQNILFRLGERESATFAFPYYTYQFSYPQRFRAEFVDDLPAGSTQYDMLCSHMRLDVGQLRQVMPLNTVYVTLLRDPVHTFASVFSYYTSVVPAFKEAQRSAAFSKKSALQVFLEAPESFWDPAEPWNGLARNSMSFDMGLKNWGWNASWADDLAHLDQTFHLVMVAEHFDESLILLKDLLRLELEELAYVRLNIRSADDIVSLSDEMKARIRSWNSLDVLLYDFFLRGFWEKTERYGADRLRREVTQLRAVLKSIRHRCLSREAVLPVELGDLIRPWQSDSATILGYELRGNLTDLEQETCLRLVLPELQYHSHLYFQQYGRDMRSVPKD